MKYNPEAHSRSLQTADDVEGRVGMLIHLEEDAERYFSSALINQLLCCCFRCCIV